MKQKTKTFILLIMFCASCGNADDPNYMNPEEAAQWYNSIDTEKLIGTPFEGLTTGDSISPSTLLCNPYRTETIESFPIPIFSALFTRSGDEGIAEAIDIANESIGFTTYEYTETWNDDVRVIYAVDEIESVADTVARTMPFYQTFNEKQYAETIAMDWVIRVSFVGGTFNILHELGHATGIGGHYLIDYEDDTTNDLEAGSIMEPDGGYGTSVMTDYNFMMSMQGQIMQDHLGEMGTIIEDVDCSE